MLIIEYDPNQTPICDGDIERQIMLGLAWSKQNGEATMRVGTANVFDALAMLLAEEKIRPHEITVYYQNERVVIDEDLNLIYPFQMVWEKMHDRTMKARRQRHTEES